MKERDGLQISQRMSGDLAIRSHYLEVSPVGLNTTEQEVMQSDAGTDQSQPPAAHGWTMWMNFSQPIRYTRRSY